jgi:hypothetical protein
VKELVASRQEQIEALERDQAWLSNYVKLGKDVSTSLGAAQKAAEDCGRGELYKKWPVPAKIEQTLSGAISLGHELQELRRAHITLQESHMQLRCEHVSLKERATGPSTSLTNRSHEALDGSALRTDGAAKIDVACSNTLESKDYQVRGMLQKLTNTLSSDPLEYQSRLNLGQPTRERVNNARPAHLIAPLQKERGSQSVTFRECESSGSGYGGVARAPGAGMEHGTTSGLSGSSSALNLRHLSTAGHMTLTYCASNPSLTNNTAQIPPRPETGTKRRAAMRDALSELLAGASGSQQGARQFGARCWSH